MSFNKNQTSNNLERRNKTRFHHEAPVTLENEEIGLLHSVRMYNYSSSGIYFESNFYLRPGTELYIGIKSSPLADEPDVYECYRSVIKWRRFQEDSSFEYGYGLLLIGLEAETTKTAVPQEARINSRKHARKKCAIPAMVSTPSATVDVLIDNISKGGIFFRSDQHLSPGQPLDLMIPMKNKGKLLKRRGTVVWSAEEGVGVQFEPGPVRS